ncbi:MULTISPECIES: TlpA family protein disulfide reductase [Sphingobacterium]|uniref:TlpA family protein disulfide reductase n=1 Tax=Sphingobacterium populi TaxID=1812824 RepID=A0ABW5U8R6_9SPHI|nr:TlpA disulfide reductase family protein [Sphingobacterium sp. CFCC 11742]
MDNKPRFSLGSKIVYGILVVLILLMFWPASRAVLQQGLMKIGLFKPKIETNPASNDERERTSDVVASAEGLKLMDVDGQMIHTKDLKGKVVFINFWATWCGPCVAEMPSIQTMIKNIGVQDDIKFMLVEVDGDMAVAQEFLKKQKLDLPIFVPRSAIPSTWMSGAIPATVVLDKHGQRVFTHKGMADYSDPEFVDYLKKLAAE